MFKDLLSFRFKAMFSSTIRDSKNKKKQSKGKIILFTILFLYLAGVFLFMFGTMFFPLLKAFHAAGLDWLYFTLGAMMSITLMFVTSVLSTQSQLFDAKDNNLLLSLPIPAKTILGSRIAYLLIFNMVFNLLVAIPLGFVYCYSCSVSVIGVIAFVLVFLLLPFFAMTLSCIIGWFIALIISKMRSKTIFTMVLSLSFLVAYLFFYTRVYSYINLLAQNNQIVASALYKIMPLYWVGNSIASADFLQLLFIALICVIPFLLCVIILSKGFNKIVTANRGAIKAKYVKREMKQISTKKALFNKELKRFFTCSAYMMNCGLGSVFLIIGAVLIVVKKSDILTAVKEIPGIGGYLSVIGVIAICTVAAMNIISAPSISLEGNNLWIIRSCPVAEKDVLNAKVKAHMAISLPGVIFAQIALLFVLKTSFIDCVILFVLPILFTYLMAVCGVSINLLVPKFDWASEMVAVKQGASTILTMLMGWALLFTPILLYGFLLSAYIDVTTFAVLMIAVYGFIGALFQKYINTKGAKRFASL